MPSLSSLSIFCDLFALSLKILNQIGLKLWIPYTRARSIDMIVADGIHQSLILRNEGFVMDRVEVFNCVYLLEDVETLQKTEEWG